MGILLSSRAENVLGKEEYISPRAMKATFTSNPETSIIVSTREKQTETFHKDFQDAIDSSPQNNYLDILGRQKRKNKSYTGKYAYSKRTNQNGSLLLELASEKYYCIGCTFQKKEGKRWKYKSQKEIGIL